jgi:arylsulfatase
MRRQRTWSVLSVAATTAFVIWFAATGRYTTWTQAQPTAMRSGFDRTTLPIKGPPSITELEARNGTAPPRFQVIAPKRAPNVVIVLIDDMGLGCLRPPQMVL